MANAPFNFDDFLDRFDIGSIEDTSNKVAECEYFLGLASTEEDRVRFRWLISAFLGAAYSFFEMSALHAYFAFTELDTGEPIADHEALAVLRSYVIVEQDKKRPSFVKTKGKHPITQRLYELRRANIHHHPLHIMANGPELPTDFQFGNMKGDGIPAIDFCREAMLLIRSVQRELEA